MYRYLKPMAVGILSSAFIMASASGAYSQVRPMPGGGPGARFPANPFVMGGAGAGQNYFVPAGNSNIKLLPPPFHNPFPLHFPGPLAPLSSVAPNGMTQATTAIPGLMPNQGMMSSTFNRMSPSMANPNMANANPNMNPLSRQPFNAANPYGNTLNPYAAGLLGGAYGGSSSYSGYGNGMSYNGYSVPYGAGYTAPNGYANRYQNSTYGSDDATAAEERRQSAEQALLERSRDKPDAADIASGKALNDLLSHLSKLMAAQDTEKAATGGPAISQDVLSHVNVMHGTASVAILRHEGRLSWPTVLRGTELQDTRDEVTKLMRDATRQVHSQEQVNAETVRKLAADANQLQNELRKTAPELDFAAHLEAKTFLNNVEAAIAALGQPDVTSYFTGDYALRAKTVPDLVKQMTANELRFAPALPGDESAYAKLHEKMAAYDRVLSQEEMNR
jgi:hypothetical protein